MSILDTATQVATGGRYTLGDARRGVTDPRLAVSKRSRLYDHYRAGQSYNPEGIGVFAEDWDTLVILDTSRDDEFDVEPVERTLTDSEYGT